MASGRLLRYAAQSKFPFIMPSVHNQMSSAKLITILLYICRRFNLDTSVHNIDSSPVTAEEKEAIMGNGRVVILLSSSPNHEHRPGEAINTLVIQSEKGTH